MTIARKPSIFVEGPIRIMRKSFKSKAPRVRG